MRYFKNIVFLVLMVFNMTIFSQCAPTNKLESNSPLEIGEVYYQHWVAGVQGAGSGVNLFIPIISNPNNIVLDSVYFQGKKTSLEYRDNTVFIGRFKANTNQKQDIIMSNEPYAEYGNKVPEISKKSQFQIQDNDCVVSYKEGNKVKYFKIKKIIKKDNVQFMGTEQKEP